MILFDSTDTTWKCHEGIKMIDFAFKEFKLNEVIECALNLTKSKRFNGCQIQLLELQ